MTSQYIPNEITYTVRHNPLKKLSIYSYLPGSCQSGVRITRSPAQEAQLLYILGSTGNPCTCGPLSCLLGACDPRAINIIEVSWEEVDLNYDRPVLMI